MTEADRTASRSAGAPAFGPDGVLFARDGKQGAVWALETEPSRPPSSLDRLTSEATDAASGDAPGGAKERLAVPGVTPPRAGNLDFALIRFDLVDVELSMGGSEVVDPPGEPSRVHGVLDPGDGRCGRVVPEHPWAPGRLALTAPDSFENLCGGRLGEVLDHDPRDHGRPRRGAIPFAAGAVAGQRHGAPAAGCDHPPTGRPA